MSELKVHIELTRFVQPEKIEIDANERAVNEKSQYWFFVCTTFDSFLNDLLDLMITDDEIQQQAVSILSALNDKERTLYILHYRQKLKLKEIAKQQNIQEATVRKQHQRLKKKLLKMIKNL